MHYTVGDIIQMILNVVRKILGAISNDAPKASNESAKLVLSHPCFNELSLWKNTKIHHLNIQNSSKRCMTEAYIRIICNICEKYVRELDGKDINELSKLFTPENITNVTSNILHEINRNAVLESIPSIFINKTTSIVYEYLGSMEETILDIQLYGRWNCKTDKILATLDIIYTTVRIIGYRIPAIVRDMNGELSAELKGSKFDTSM